VSVVANTSLSQFSRDCVRRFLSTTDGHPALQLHRMILAEVEKPLLEEVLQHCTYNLTHAAELLGLSRATLRKKLDDYRIKH
jgi:Fis family transcriptional regulator, factor for inversion stimulation protein